MSRGAEAIILRGVPGFASMEAAIGGYAGRAGTVITSSSSAAIAQVRDLVEGSDAWLPAYETGDLGIHPLGELVGQFCEYAELSRGHTASRDHQVAIAAVACQNLKEGRFAAAKELPGFHEALSTAMQELRRHGIRLADLPDLTPELQEVCNLQIWLEGALERFRLDTLSGRISDLVERRPVRPSGLRRVLWVGETEWHPLWRMLTRWMLDSGIQLVLLTERHPADEGFFPAGEELRDSLPEAKAIDLPTPAHPGSAVFSEESIDAGGIRFIRAADEFTETETTVRLAIAETNLGTAPNQVCVFAPNLSDYGPLLVAAAKRVGASLAMSRQEPLLTNPFARHCLRALRACVSNDLASAAEMAGSGYGGVAPSLRFRAVRALQELGHGEDAWEAAMAAATDPDSPVPAWLGSLASWRAKVLRRSATLADWGHSLNRLVARMPWLEASVGGDGLAERDASAQDAMVRSLSISRLCAEHGRLHTLGTFVEHCDATWRNAKYTVRTRLGIRVVSEPASIGKCSLLIVVGMMEGMMPRRRAEDPILLDRDREALRQRRPEWTLKSSYQVAEEDRRNFYRLLCSAPRVVLCYPLSLSEAPQIRTTFLDDVERCLQNVTTETLSYDQRFPLPSADLSDADILCATAFHGEEHPRVSERLATLRQAVANARTDVIQDDALRAEIAKLPHPMRLSHMRALQRCPFQYAAMAKLGLRSRQPPWLRDRLLNIVRRTDLKTSDLQKLQARLLASLNNELESLRGREPDVAVETLAIAAPATLNAFAVRELASRQRWKMEIAEQNVPMWAAGMRSEFPIDGEPVVLDEKVDIVYRMEKSKDLVPVRLAAAGKSDSHAWKFESALMMLLQQGNKQVRAAAVDSLENETRDLTARSVTNFRVNFPLDNTHGLASDNRSESDREFIRNARDELRCLLRKAKTGNIEPTPGEYCSRCDYSSLCRRALRAQVGPAGALEDEN